MKVLVLGGTGATGKLLVRELLNRNLEVVAVVRSSNRLPEDFVKKEKLTVIEDSISDLDLEKACSYIAGCDAVISCLGHNLNFKGILGKPFKLVTDATRLFCEAILFTKKNKSVKFILMNTTGNRNKYAGEVISFREKLVIGLVRALLPPQRDNESAAKFLQSNIGLKSKCIGWVAVRPDTLIDNNETSEYEIHKSPIRSAIFNPGKTSRINVGHFMAELITDDELWQKWKGEMPVIYNKE
ncbi:MAG: NAD(P)H-binding protein [Spirochaetaceae bacterium]